MEMKGWWNERVKMKVKSMLALSATEETSKERGLRELFKTV